MERAARRDTQPRRWAKPVIAVAVVAASLLGIADQAAAAERRHHRRVDLPHLSHGGDSGSTAKDGVVLHGSHSRLEYHW